MNDDACPVCGLRAEEPIHLARHFYWDHYRKEIGMGFNQDKSYPFSATIETWDQALAYVHKLILGVKP